MSIVEGYRGADVADSIVAHTPTGTIHALRPAEPHYLVSVADDLLVLPAVTIARRVVGHEDDLGRWVVPAHIAASLVEALQRAGDGDATDLLALTVREMNRKSNQKESKS